MGTRTLIICLLDRAGVVFIDDKVRCRIFIDVLETTEEAFDKFAAECSMYYYTRNKRDFERVTGEELKPHNFGAIRHFFGSFDEQCDVNGVFTDTTLFKRFSFKISCSQSEPGTFSLVDEKVEELLKAIDEQDKQEALNIKATSLYSERQELGLRRFHDEHPEWTEVAMRQGQHPHFPKLTADQKKWVKDPATGPCPEIFCQSSTCENNLRAYRRLCYHVRTVSIADILKAAPDTAKEVRTRRRVVKFKHGYFTPDYLSLQAKACLEGGFTLDGIRQLLSIYGVAVKHASQNTRTEEQCKNDTTWYAAGFVWELPGAPSVLHCPLGNLSPFNYYYY